MEVGAGAEFVFRRIPSTPAVGPNEFLMRAACSALMIVGFVISPLSSGRKSLRPSTSK